MILPDSMGSVHKSSDFIGVRITDKIRKFRFYPGYTGACIHPNDRRICQGRLQTKAGGP